MNHRPPSGWKSIVLIAGGLFLILPLAWAVEGPGVNGNDKSAEDDAARAPVPAIDFHCDTLNELFEARSLSGIKDGDHEVTIARMRDGRVAAQFFAAWIKPEQRPRAYEHANKLIDWFHRMVEQNPDDLALALGAADIKHNASRGRISCLLSIEGGEAIGDVIGRVDHFHNRGVRLITLTWNHHNQIADAAVDKTKPRGGLTDFGEQVIKRMNKLGMIVDVSHTSDGAVRDALRLSKAPIIASHSCARALADRERNLSDELVKAICDKGGLVAVNFHSYFLVEEGGADVKDVADHIDHLVKVGGLGCVALGSDFDGMIEPPAGLEHVGKLQELAVELEGRGYTREQVGKVFSGNAVRLIEAVIGD